MLIFYSFYEMCIRDRSGNVITINSRNSIIEGNEKLIATVGVNNLIVVDTEAVSYTHLDVYKRQV